MTIDEQRVLSVEVSVLGPIHFKIQQSLFDTHQSVPRDVASNVSIPRSRVLKLRFCTHRAKKVAVRSANESFSIDSAATRLFLADALRSCAFGPPF